MVSASSLKRPGSGWVASEVTFDDHLLTCLVGFFVAAIGFLLGGSMRGRRRG
jgi:hypothetical protein